MPQSIAKVLVHLIFSTKHREPVIYRALRPALHAYLDGIFQNLKCPSLQTGGTADHVHALFMLARTLSIAEVAEEVKKISQGVALGYRITAPSGRQEEKCAGGVARAPTTRRPPSQR